MPAMLPVGAAPVGAVLPAEPLPNFSMEYTPGEHAWFWTWSGAWEIGVWWYVNPWNAWVWVPTVPSHTGANAANAQHRWSWATGWMFGRWKWSSCFGAWAWMLGSAA